MQATTLIFFIFFYISFDIFLYNIFYISFDIFVICFTMKSGTPLPPGSRHCFATGFSWLRCAPPCCPQVLGVGAAAFGS